MSFHTLSPASRPVAAALRSGLNLRSTTSAWTISVASLATSSAAHAQADTSKPGLAVRSPPSSQPPKRFSAAPLSSPIPIASKPHSKLTVAIVRTLARLMGYNRAGSSAIRVTSDLYDRCGEVAELQKDFWYGEAGLPHTYQTWFHITHLHVWILLVRFRAMNDKVAAAKFSQELINHFFIDAESRMRERFGVQTARLVKGYMRDMHQQQRGALVGFDQGLATTSSDASLSEALWRNIWGAGGFGGKVGGVKRKIKGIDRTDKGEDDSEEGTPELHLDPVAAAAASSTAAASVRLRDPLARKMPELSYPQHLAKLTAYVRREVARLAETPDERFEQGLEALLRDGDSDLISGSVFGRL